MITLEQREALQEAACAARERAYAPYSNFLVGAAVLGESGTIYTGVNIENAAYGSTICGERVAVFKAVENGERKIQAVAVCTENGASPCGSCRQVMREFADDIPVFMGDVEGRFREVSLSYLLPDSFSPEDLESGG